MKNILRLLAVFALLGGIFWAAQADVVGAEPFNPEGSSALIGSVDSSFLLNVDAAGTVKPPANSVVITEDGKYSVGGICTIQVEGLSEEYGLRAYNINREVLGALPPEAIRILSGTCYIQYFQRPSRVDIAQLPGDAGTATICFAHIPQNKVGRIYSYNLTSGVWAPLTTFVEKITPSNRDIACAPALQSMAYALLRVRE